MKKVLVISYAFHDKRIIGAVRIHGLAKFLPNFGWEPIILTSKSKIKSNKEYDIKVISTDYNPPKILDKKVNINNINKKMHKNNSLIDTNKVLNTTKKIFTDIFYYPDEFKYWYKSALKRVEKVLKDIQIDAIISSYNPASSHLIAYKLKSKYSLPWIADFRDLWTQNHYYSHTKIRELVEKKFEKRIISKADYLVTTTKPFAQKLQKMHNIKTFYIPNGFDRDEIKGIKTKSKKKFTITYTGVLYRGRRDPSILFYALKDLIKEEKIDPNEIEINFYGKGSSWLNQDISNLSLDNIVKNYNMVDRKVALRKQKESDILLLLLWDHPEEKNIPGKLFDYLAVKRPILAIGGKKSVVKKILEETNSGVFLHHKDEIKQYILRNYKSWKNSGSIPYLGKTELIEDYSQEKMAKKFAQILDLSTQ